MLNMDLQLISFTTTLIPLRIVSFLSHFLGVILWFFFIYLLSKSFAVIKYGLNYRSGDIFIEIVKIYFLPIGIWFMQPQINKLYKELKRVIKHE